jgi:hypothetical protein
VLLIPAILENLLASLRVTLKEFLNFGCFNWSKKTPINIGPVRSAGGGITVYKRNMKYILEAGFSINMISMYN